MCIRVVLRLLNVSHVRIRIRIALSDFKKIRSGELCDFLRSFFRIAFGDGTDIPAKIVFSCAGIVSD